MQGIFSVRDSGAAELAHAFGVSQVMGYEDSFIPVGIPTQDVEVVAPSEVTSSVEKASEEEPPRMAMETSAPPEEDADDEDDDVVILEGDFLELTTPITRSTV